ncbi:MAG: biotin--[acetyl-CoA-carboxylase] ligase [Deltaproteobacteria bacterium]|nr:biotin--[acetyl-CoA-carboxylase] ligase [Deltaproteobacteria bacterium]
MQAKPAVVRYPEADSTNSLALELGRQGAPHGTVVVAARQTGGRGRAGRGFVSPPGGLYMSVILRPDLALGYLRLVTLAAGVACSVVLEKHGISPLLKWPNDLYCGRKKLGGILTETAPWSAAQAGVPFVVVGIGLNVNSLPADFPPPLPDLVTSLSEITHRRHDLDLLRREIVRQLDYLVSGLEHNTEALFSLWRQRDFLLGRNISWQDENGLVVHGTGAGLLPDGSYRLRTPEGLIHPILAGVLKVHPGRLTG